MDNARIETRFDAGQIAARVEDLAAVLDREFAGAPPVLVSVLKGSSFFLADLARRMTVPLSCEFISVSRQEGPDEILQIDFATGFRLAGRPVVLLKDVVNSGVIETYLMTQLDAAEAGAIRLVAMIDKKTERKTDVTVDFALFFSRPGALRRIRDGARRTMGASALHCRGFRRGLRGRKYFAGGNKSFGASVMLSASESLSRAKECR